MKDLYRTQRAFQRRNRLEELCVNCGGVPKTERLHCEQCLDQAKERARNYRRRHPFRVKKYQKQYREQHDRSAYFREYHRRLRDE